MKKFICYLGIIILFLLAIFPPVLRIVLPNKVVKKKEIIKEKIILSCSNSNFTVANSYNGDEIDMVVLKKINNQDNTKSKNLLNLFDSLKNEKNINYSTSNDGEIISIDFTISNHADLKIDDLIKNVEEQQKYYEQEDLVCNIKK